MKKIPLALVVLLAPINLALAQGGTCEFDPQGILQIRIGDPETKIREVLNKGHEIVERSGKAMQRRIEVLQPPANRLLYSFALSNDGRVVFMDIYTSCLNSEGIGPGSRLGEAKKRYGKAKLEPTDTGYFIVFDKIPTVGFKLNSDDLPRSIRNLPDDSIDKKIERMILATSRARFAQVRIHPK